MQSNKIFSLKITLNYTAPSVWRRILVPSGYSFFDLHCAIQDAMGWLDSHLHGFSISQKGTIRPLNIKLPDADGEDGWLADDDYKDERKEKISDFFGKSIKQCIYTYDYGDNWDHTVLFEKEIDAAPNQEYPQCVAGKNACPPEDCGGIPGYYNLIKVLKNPKNDQHEDMLEWLNIEDPKEFNPSYFDPKEIDFVNPKTRLREVQKGFGIKPLKP